MNRSNCFFFRPLAVVTAIAACAAAMSACAPLVIGGAMVGSALVATDRRTSGTQVEDQAIELKAGRRVGEVLGEAGHVNVTSYARTVLITGEVPGETEKAAIEQAVTRVENVKSTVNELVVAPAASITSRSTDAIVTSKVKATFIDAKDIMANAFKITTERGTVYLMGRVTEREANRATDLARSINGVQKVVRVFDIVSEAELAGTLPAQPKTAQ